MDSRILACQKLLEAYKTGKLGECRMPEESHPVFISQDLRLTYFTLPMALNYQRDSYALWASALKTINDPETKEVFDVKASAELETERLRQLLTKHKLALQPNKHVQTWQTIAKTIVAHWGTVGNLLQACGHDYVQLRSLLQEGHKKGFPYLSGPKIFNYWCFILGCYGGVQLKHADEIEIAPDTHITQGSVKLGIITAEEAISLSKQQIADRWKTLLQGSGILPIEMHPPLWFWSRSSFQYSPQ